MGGKVECRDAVELSLGRHLVAEAEGQKQCNDLTQAVTSSRGEGEGTHPRP